MIKLWVILFVVLLCYTIGIRYYIKHFVFNQNTLFTSKTRRLFRKTGMIYIECIRLYGHYFQKPTLLIVDTGATTNFIREDLINMIYPQYKNKMLYGDDVMSVNGTMTLNKIVDVPVFLKPALACKIPFTLLTHTESLDFLSKECNNNVIGIIGTEFLQQHGIDMNFKAL